MKLKIEDWKFWIKGRGQRLFVCPFLNWSYSQNTAKEGPSVFTHKAYKKAAIKNSELAD